MTATPIAGGIRVTWEDLSDNESEFVVYRSDADAAEGEDGAALTEVGRSPGDATFYQDFGVTMGGSYRYAVAAINQFGASDQVLQEPSDPVSPAVGVRLTITVDGAGHVAVDDGFETVTCASECVFGVTSGATVSLTAVGSDETAFAGWAGACGGAGTCRLTPSADADVEARFREHVLVLVSTGDSPVLITNVSPPDEFGESECLLAAGESCAFGYDFASTLKVSINSVVVEAADGAVFAGYGGACTAPQGRFCVIDVSGETIVEAEVVRAPVVSNQSYPGREDTELEVAAENGLLRDVVDSPGDTHVAEVVTEPASGALTLSSDGAFTFVPEDHANGPVTFEFRAVDAHGNQSATRTVTLNIAAVNDPPRFELGGDPQATFGHGNQVTRANFATGVHPGGGPDEAGQELTFDVTQTSGAPDLFSAAPVLTRTGNSATLTYTPAAGAVGTASFDVFLEDDAGTANGGEDTSGTRSFTITVAPTVLTTSVSAGSGGIARNPPGAGTGTPGVAAYPWNTSVTLTANADPGYRFAGWTGACSSTTESTCTVTMDGNKSVSAAFSAVVQVTGGAFTTVTSTPAGINCNPWIGGSGCTHAFTVGTSVTLSWDGNTRPVSGVTCNEGSPTTSCTFTVTGPVTVEVHPVQ